MIPLRNEENESYFKQEVCYICKKISIHDKKYYGVKDHCHYTGKYRRARHIGCNLNYKAANGIPVEIHNGYTYNYHYIIKEPAKEF